MKPPEGAQRLSLTIGVAKADSAELFVDDVALTRKAVGAE